MSRLVVALLVAWALFASVAAAQAPAPLALLISIDGLRPDYVTAAERHGLKIPALRRFVTEGTSSTAFILDVNGTIRTQPLGHHILPGVTRRAVLRLAKEEGLTIEERPFTVAEAREAREAFLTAASAFVLPVVEIDGATVGSGTPGTVVARLREIYLEEMRKSAV